MLFSCDIVLLTAAGAEHHIVNPLEIIRHLAAAVAHSLLNDLLPVDLDKIGKELIELVVNIKEIPDGYHANNFAFCVDNR